MIMHNNKKKRRNKTKAGIIMKTVLTSWTGLIVYKPTKCFR